MAKKNSFDILEHELVPKHIVLSKEEAKKLLDALKIKAHQLPWIRENDPVCRKIKAKPGDIVMIIRNSPTAGKAVAYRLVVPKWVK